MIWVADLTQLRYLEAFRQSYIWRKILESVLVCSTAACIIASISIFPRGFSMGTTERLELFNRRFLSASRIDHSWKKAQEFFASVEEAHPWLGIGMWWLDAPPLILFIAFMNSLFFRSACHHPLFQVFRSSASFRGYALLTELEGNASSSLITMTCPIASEILRESPLSFE